MSSLCSCLDLKLDIFIGRYQWYLPTEWAKGKPWMFPWPLQLPGPWRWLTGQSPAKVRYELMMQVKGIYNGDIVCQRLCTQIYIYICIYTWCILQEYIFICIYIHACILICIHICIHACIHTYMSSCLHPYTPSAQQNTCLPTNQPTYLPTCLPTYVHTDIHDTHIIYISYMHYNTLHYTTLQYIIRSLLRTYRPTLMVISYHFFQ